MSFGGWLFPSPRCIELVREEEIVSHKGRFDLMRFESKAMAEFVPFFRLWVGGTTC